VTFQTYRPRTGPHKLRECVPLALVLRTRLRYALSGQEVYKIVKDKDGHIKINNVVRKDTKFPVGFQDVISINKTGEHFRVLFDVKGRFSFHKIQEKEAKTKLSKIKRRALGPNKVPYIVTHDGKTIRYPNPEVRVNDTVKINLETGEIEGVLHFENNNTVMVTGGNSIGRVGVISHTEKHQGSHDIAHIRDSRGNTFATRASNVFVIGEGKKNLAITLPKAKGIKLNIIEERDVRKQDEDSEDDE
jgi:small subunit ribosomal protein S4e